jgi:hypothetical protein
MRKSAIAPATMQVMTMSSTGPQKAGRFSGGGGGEVAMIFGCKMWEFAEFFIAWCWGIFVRVFEKMWWLDVVF